ncbi:hypothetical protein OAT07_05065 [Candidatus Pelagibacter sp.]|nr:hypothetical protein [Candidatus Pelagibacter sp.]
MTKEKKKKEKNTSSIFNNKPWHAAFIFPILFLIGSWLLSGLFMLADNYFFNNNQMNFLAWIGTSIIFISLLTPVWVFSGLIISKNKLPYILSLIIGISLLLIVMFYSPQY